MLRLVTLYSRSRLVPAALVTVVAGALFWWATLDTSDPRQTVLPIGLGIGVAAGGLGGADVQLERTGAIPWMSWRMVHLAGIVLVVTGALFTSDSVWLVLRDVAGLTGLAALGVAVVGTQLAWVLPVTWTAIAVVFPIDDPVLMWMIQAPESQTAAIVAGVLGIGGACCYVVLGPRG